ncbi:MAG TPA: GntR family transcriptional regulator [Chloroflexia bacterium]|nr:GntR family transcriptional regulator [Chloroflexia bacterium]
MKAPLYVQVYNSILDEIKSGKLAKGDRIPSEKELTEQFKVSRITSKKALEILVQDGVVERMRGKGSFVSKNLPNLARLETLHASLTAAEKEEEELEGPVIGLILEGFAASYGLNLLGAIEQRCSERGCFLMMKRTYARQEIEEQAIKAFQHVGVDGLIIYPVHDNYYNTSLLRLVLDKFPLVLVDRYLKGIAACAVYTDNRLAAQKLTEYLIELGHREIAFVSPPQENTSTIEERVQGFTTAFTEYDTMPVQPHLLTSLYSTLPTDSHSDALRADEAALVSFINANPQLTAFVACEYAIAVLIRRVLTGMGKRVPEDYSIVCFDSPGEDFGEPFFTHVQQDEDGIGRAAVDLILKQLQGESAPLQTNIDFRIIEGSSTLRLEPTALTAKI